MSSPQPIFQLRKDLRSEPETAQTVDSSKPNQILANQQSKVLTENEKYIIERIPTSEQFESLKPSNCNGLVDVISNTALINDKENLYIWDYTSRHTNYKKIPLPVDSLSATCLLTWPITMDDTTTQLFKESGAHVINNGVCIINKQTGIITYYQDIESINNLYTQLSRSLAHVLDVNLGRNEVITLTLNVEPSGLLVATSHGRVLYITLRDHMGKPKIQLKQQLIKSHNKFIFKMFSNSTKIVSLKAGPLLGKGERLVYITTSSGDFQVWQLSPSSTIKRVDRNIFNDVLDSLQDLYPFANGTLTILDSHPLDSNKWDSHIFLSSISEGSRTFYILSTIIFDEQSKIATIFSTYRLNTYVLPLDSNQTPKLYVPEAVQTNRPLENNEEKPNGNIISILVLFPKAIVLTQISAKLDASFTLRRKWEDIISLNENINIIGTGYGLNQLCLMSNTIFPSESTATTLDIIKLSLKKSQLENENENENEIGFIKSHIDQAVYFSNVVSNPIQFNLPKSLTLDQETIENDLLTSMNEIFSSTGKYIPPIVPDKLDIHLKRRIDYFENLLEFIRINFNDKTSVQLKLSLIENFEIMNCLYSLLPYLGKNELNSLSGILNAEGLTIDTLIVGYLDKFPKIFTQLLKDTIFDRTFVNRDANFKSKLSDLLISTIYEAVLEQGEKNLRYELFQLNPTSEVSNELPWFTNYDLLHSINELFFKFKFSLDKNDIVDEPTSNKFLTLVKTLYYLFDQVKNWVAQDSTNRMALSTINEINTLYKENHVGWNEVLCELNLNDESLKITEFYMDLEASFSANVTDS